MNLLTQNNKKVNIYLVKLCLKKIKIKLGLVIGFKQTKKLKHISLIAILSYIYLWFCI